MRNTSIVIPSRNAENLSACVKAIRAVEGNRYPIIVVDDGVNWDAATGAEHVDVVKGVKPFVFARNVNIGIRAAGQDDVIVMNDDALVRGNHPLSELVRWNNSEGPESRVKPFVFARSVNIGIRAAGQDDVIVMNDEALVRGNHPPYGLFGAVSNSVGNTRQMRYGPVVAGDVGGLIEEPRMLCFICVLIPRKTIHFVGRLDERYTGYGMDDDDYSLRVRKAGLRIGICEGCFVEHKTLESSYRGKGGKGGDFMPNLKLFIEKWGHDNRGLDREHSPYRALFPTR